ncbi:MAG: TolC family protein, partial [Planctomycetota bacterium]
VVVLLAGCLSPERAVLDADDAAYDIIAEKQQAAIGREEAFTIDELEDRLRRKLMIDQQLPAAGEASLGRNFLSPVPKQPGGVSDEEAIPDDVPLVRPRDFEITGLGVPTLATDLALFDIGNTPEGTKAVLRPSPPPTSRPAPEPVILSLVEALQVGARNNREYQANKEAVYIAALNLDVQRDEFELQFGGVIDVDAAADFDGQDRAGVVVSPELNVTKAFKTGASMSTRIGIDLAKLLTGTRPESLGVFADVSITVPLLSGAGVEVVTEPLQQAERSAVYAIWDFERFKREFAVDTTTRFYDVLVARDQIANAATTLQRLEESLDRSMALFDEGRLPGIQLDRVRSNQLRAESRLILAQQRYETALDSFKVFLGLPTDALVELDDAALTDLQGLADDVLGGLDVGERGPEIEQLIEPEQSAGGATRPETLPAPTTTPVEVRGYALSQRTDAERSLIRLALQRRLDLAIVYGRVVDAQRATVVAADGLEGVLDFVADGSYGGRRGAFSGGSDDATIRFGDGSYGLGLRLDLPIERTAERNRYRRSIIDLERAVRSAQQVEDGVKADVLRRLRALRTAGDDLRIQFESIRVADRRVEAATLLVELGRGNTFDITDALDDLTEAEDDFTQSLVDYRLAELELQRDTGVLSVGPDGLYEEVDLSGIY